MITRRRLLTISAAAIVAAATRVDWHGRALGAEASIRLTGPLADTALQAVRDTLARVEAAFSLFDPASDLSRLNRDGAGAVSAEFARLWPRVLAAYEATEGLFDPTIQRRWRALAEGRAVTPSGRLRDVKVTATEARLPPDTQLSLNGIAQGYATDRVFALLMRLGYRGVVVDIGEWRADAPATLAIAGTDRVLARTTLSGGAIATSSPGALTVGGQPHILHPTDPEFRPRWRTVSVEAADAATADALSTALCLTRTDDLAKRLVAAGLAKRVWLEDADGSLREFG